MKPYNIDRAKDLNDQWINVRDARHKLRQDSVVYMIIKDIDGDTLVVINATQAGSVLDDKETDLKKRLAVIGIDVGE